MNTGFNLYIFTKCRNSVDTNSVSESICQTLVVVNKQGEKKQRCRKEKFRQKGHNHRMGELPWGEDHVWSEAILGAAGGGKSGV